MNELDHTSPVEEVVDLKEWNAPTVNVVEISKNTKGGSASFADGSSGQS